VSLISILYIENTNEALCFLLFQSLISILYIENTDEYIEHTNEVLLVSEMRYQLR